MNWINIKDFGAIGDGVTCDSAAIQKAFDTVSNAGGGTVIIPPGKYLAANLQLRSNLTIHLQTGATLIGPATSESYEPDPTVQQHTLVRYQLCGKDVHNVVIEGGGCLDGAGHHFWEEKMFNDVVRVAKPNRPVVLYLLGCTGITLRDFQIRDAAAYTVWMLGCKNVQITGVTIRNDRKGPNTDALDIDCCSNVRISNCDIIAGDDCIALKSDVFRLKRPDAVCENIVVSNCVFSSSTCAIRVGYEGDGAIRDCIFQGLVCYQCAKVICMQSLVVPAEIYHVKHGARIENIMFSDFVLRDVDRAFFFRAGGDVDVQDYTGYIRNISISNIRGNVKKESFIGSVDGYSVSGIRMDRIRLAYTGTEPSSEGELPEIWGHQHFPQAMLALRYVRDIQINDLELAGAKPMLGQYVDDGWLNGEQLPESWK